MGGEHRDVGQLVEERLQLGGADPLGVKLAQGMVERAHPQGTALADMFGAIFVLIGLFRQIDQTEIGTEGPHHVGEGVRIEFADQLGKPGAASRALLFLQADIALAQGFHRHQHVPTRLGTQDITQ